jgi:hypothetical protein
MSDDKLLTDDEINALINHEIAHLREALARAHGLKPSIRKEYIAKWNREFDQTIERLLTERKL